MEKKFRFLLLLALLMTAATGAWAQEQWDVVWDFTAWSTETITALKADAAASKLEGWSDVEKAADAEAGADPTDATKDNCFWSCSGTVNADGNLSANGAVIKEFQGLKFNSDYAAKRTLAIAVNYPSTSLGTYHGPAYLYLGGSNQTCFTIPGVKAGSKITIEVESDKTSSARGIGLYKNSYAAENLIGEQFTPKTFEAKTWEIAEDCNVVVYNTNRCHIYTIKVKAPAAAPTYAVTFAEGTDPNEWTASPAANVTKGQTVTVTYTGTKKVLGVKAEKKAAAAAKTLAEATSEDIGKIAGKDGKIYATKADAEAVATGNAVAMIAYVGSATEHGTYTHGLAIALANANEGEMNWSTAKSSCEGKTAVTGAAWLLPSQSQWKTMFSANGGKEDDYTGLQTAANNAGGVGTLQQGTTFWTSTESGDNAYSVGLHGMEPKANFYSDPKTNYYYARPVLAF